MPVKVTVDRAGLDSLIAHTGGKVERYVADGVEYGIYQETGTSRMAAQPFMHPAAEAVRPGLTQALKNQLTDAQVEGVVVKAAFDIEGIAKQLAPVDTGALKNSIHVTEAKP